VASIRVTVFVITILISLVSFATTVEKVTVEGWGETIDLAKEDAGKEAVAQVVGMYTVSDSLVRNGELINDEVLTYSNGYIMSFKTTNSRREGDFWLVSAEVEVEVGKVTQKLRDIHITTIGSPEFEIKVAGAFTNAEKFRKVFKKEVLDPIFKDGSAYKKEFLGMEPYVDDSSSTLKEGQHIYRFIPNDKSKYEGMEIIPFAMKFKVSLSDDYIEKTKKLYNYLSNGDRKERICTSPIEKGKPTDCCDVSSVCVVELINSPEEKNWFVGSEVVEYKFSSINNRIANSEFIKIRDLYDISRHSGAYFNFEFFNESEESVGKVVLGGIDPCKNIRGDKKYLECEKGKGVISGSHYSSTPIITPYEVWGDPWYKGVLPMISGFYINKKALISNQQEFVVIVLLDEKSGRAIKDVQFNISWSNLSIPKG